jgi:hypothetical protein
MGTGTKIAVGCGCVALLGAAAVVGVLGVGAWWAKGKIDEARGGLEEMTARTREIERFEQKADANPYTPPADGVIAEERFLKFLETRKRIYAVYERNESQLEALRKKAESEADKVTLSDLWSAGGALTRLAADIRLAQVRALAELGMSEREYRDIRLAVYKSAWASAAAGESGRQPAEAVSESLSKAAEQVRQAVEAGSAAAQREGVPGATQVSPEDARKLEAGMKQLGQDAEEALRVPPRNVALFRAHEAEIKKYAMNGLAFLGL